MECDCWPAGLRTCFSVSWYHNPTALNVDSIIFLLLFCFGKRERVNYKIYLTETLQISFPSVSSFPMSYLNRVLFKSMLCHVILYRIVWFLYRAFPFSRFLYILVLNGKYRLSAQCSATIQLHIIRIFCDCVFVLTICFQEIRSNMCL